MTLTGTPTPAPMATALVLEDLPVFVGLGINDLLEGVSVCLLVDTVVEAAVAVEVEEPVLEEQEVEGATPILVTAEGVPIEQNQYHLHRI
jgi:hypothetical protein